MSRSRNHLRREEAIVDGASRPDGTIALDGERSFRPAIGRPRCVDRSRPRRRGRGRGDGVAPCRGPLGYGACRGPGSDADVFQDRGDPDCVAILESILEAKRALEMTMRFDMPGFRPGPEYLREMERFEIPILGADAGGTIDVHAADRAYWRSLWYWPEASGGTLR